jgi:hypothetical protein
MREVRFAFKTCSGSDSAGAGVDAVWCSCQPLQYVSFSLMRFKHFDLILYSAYMQALIYQILVHGPTNLGLKWTNHPKESILLMNWFSHYIKWKSSFYSFSAHEEFRNICEDFFGNAPFCFYFHLKKVIITK